MTPGPDRLVGTPHHDHVCTSVERANKRIDQRRLADARLAGHKTQLAMAGGGAIERTMQRRELGFATDDDPTEMIIARAVLQRGLELRQGMTQLRDVGRRSGGSRRAFR